MSSNAVTWALNMMDKMSGPASAIERKLHKIDERMAMLKKAEGTAAGGVEKQRIAYERLGLELKRNSLEMKAMGDHSHNWIGTLDHGLHIVKLLGEGMHKAGEWLMKPLELAAKDEVDVLSLKALFGGSKSKASGWNEHMKDMGESGPFSGSQMTGWSRTLLGAGYGQRDTSVLLKAMTDASAMNGFQSGSMDTAMTALRNVSVTGQLNAKTMKQLAAAGVPVTATYERLGKMLGVSAKAARELVKEGKVSSSNGLYAMVGAIKDSRAGGHLGSVGGEYANQTVMGLWGKISSRFERMFEGTEETGGWATLKRFMGQVADALDPASEQGKRVRESVDKMMSGILTSVFGTMDKEAIPGFVNRVSVGIENLGPKIEKVVGTLGRMVGYVDRLMSVGDMGGATGDVKAGDMGYFTRVNELRKRRLGGSDSGWGTAWQFMNPFGAAGDMLGGANMSDDQFAGYINGDPNGYRSALAAKPPAVNAQGGGVGTINVTVHAPGATTETAQAIANKTATATGDEVAGALARVAQSRGSIQ